MDETYPDQTRRDEALKQARKIAKEAPDIREARVAAAKQALQDETLMLDANQLADKLLDDPLHQADSDSEDDNTL